MTPFVPAQGWTEAQLARFWELSTDLFSIIGFDGFHRHVNPATTRLLGYSEAELVAMPVLDMTHPDDLEHATRAFDKLLRGEPVSGECRVVCKDGSVRWIEYTATAEADQQLIYTAARDVTRRKQAEEALREAEGAIRAAEARYRSLVEQLPLVIYMDRLDDVSSNIYTSPQVTSILGYTPEEWAADPELFVKVIHPDDLQRVVAEMNAERPEPYRVEYRMIAKDGHVIWFLDESVIIRDEQGRPLYGQGYLLDITAQKEAEEEQARLEEELRQAHKMEAIGRLAGGVAHDFNNLLTAIRGYSELALADVREHDLGVRAALEQIAQAADRAAGLTRQLLAFGRKQLLEPRVLNLNAVVAGVEEMFRRLIGEHIALHVVLGADLGRVKADRGQLEQVLANLAVNARDAMPDGGVLTIETENMELGAAARQRFDLPSGPYVALKVSDTGTGMDELTLSRAFEPFFTTKALGKGTGLGLSTVYGIVRQSGGGIAATSQPEKGTTFTILLPRTSEAELEARVAREDVLPTGTETVLVVEDEPAVRQFVCRTLDQQGYEVLSASSPSEALERYEESEEPIDLLVTDVVMPGVGGRELAQRLATARPALKVLYITGYTEDVAVRSAAMTGVLLEKPFRTGDLARKVRDALDRDA